MIETRIDTLNAAAIFDRCEEEYEARQERWPLIVLGTITTPSGRTLSGQTPEAFYYSIAHARPMAVGSTAPSGPTSSRVMSRP